MPSPDPQSFAKPAGFLRARLSPEGYLGLHLTIGMLALLVAIFVFANIAEDVVTRDSLVLWDERVLQWMQAHATTGLTEFLLFITTWHNTVGILAMTALLAIYLAYKRAWDWVLRLLLTVPLGMLLNVLLKNLFERHRPTPDHPLVTLMTYSFPSGHVASATLFYGVLAGYLVALLRARSHTAAVLIVLAALAMIALVALSRMYLGAHYLSDVMASTASSTAWLAITFTGISTWRRRQTWLLSRT